MEWLRVSRNPWGQEVLQGVSWDLLWLFVGVGVAFVVAHMLYTRALASRRRGGKQ